MNPKLPTPYPDLNTVLQKFVSSAQTILGSNFLAAYLQGSFAVGDYDHDSDVDFTVVIKHELSDSTVLALQQMHVRLFKLESEWAKHLEGSYFPKDILKSADPAKTKLWYLDNAHDQLILSDHDNSLVVRWVVREYGIPLAGSDPKEWIDPVSAESLRREILSVMETWAEAIFAGRWRMDNRWAQPFAVLSYCRMLHTLHTGRIASKRASAKWAMDWYGHRWAGMIHQASVERPNPSLKVQQAADPKEVEETLAFIRFALERAERFMVNG